MPKRRITHSHNMKKGMLDDDYILFDNGEVLHQYDKSQYPGQFNLSETLTVDQISSEIKDDFVKNAAIDDRELVMRLIER